MSRAPVRISKAIVFFVAMAGLMFLRSPLYSIGYRATHGGNVTFRGLRLDLPRWYTPMHADSSASAYFDAGSSIPHRGRVLGIMLPPENVTSYESYRKFWMEALHATTVKEEKQLQTSIGVARCFDIDLTRGTEVHCRWDSGSAAAVYVGPTAGTNDLYKFVQSVSVAR